MAVSRRLDHLVINIHFKVLTVLCRWFLKEDRLSYYLLPKVWLGPYSFHTEEVGVPSRNTLPYMHLLFLVYLFGMSVTVSPSIQSELCEGRCFWMSGWEEGMCMLWCPIVPVIDRGSSTFESPPEFLFDLLKWAPSNYSKVEDLHWKCTNTFPCS